MSQIYVKPKNKYPRNDLSIYQTMDYNKERDKTTLIPKMKEKLTSSVPTPTPSFYLNNCTESINEPPEKFINNLTQRNSQPKSNIKHEV